jgi:hypothetical protein
MNIKIIVERGTVFENISIITVQRKAEREAQKGFNLSIIALHISYVFVRL